MPSIAGPQPVGILAFFYRSMRIHNKRVGAAGPDEAQPTALTLSSFLLPSSLSAGAGPIVQLSSHTRSALPNRTAPCLGVAWPAAAPRAKCASSSRGRRRRRREQDWNFHFSFASVGTAWLGRWHHWHGQIAAAELHHSSQPRLPLGCLGPAGRCGNFSIFYVYYFILRSVGHPTSAGSGSSTFTYRWCPQMVPMTMLIDACNPTVRPV